MAARKLFIIFAILSGLLALQGTVAESFPREKTRTEITVGLQQEQSAPAIAVVKEPVLEFSIRETLQKPQVQRPQLLALIISSQQHHATL